MSTAFQANAFQNNAFQIDGGAPPVPSTHPGGKLLPRGAARVTGPAQGRRRRHITLRAAFSAPQPKWQADLDYNDDELAISLLLEN